MNIDKINKTVEVCIEFLARARELRKIVEAYKYPYPLPPKESGAVRRASMELTRALAEMRKPY